MAWRHFGNQNGGGFLDVLSTRFLQMGKTDRIDDWSVAFAELETGVLVGDA